jgi:hypothetical protein
MLLCKNGSARQKPAPSASGPLDVSQFAPAMHASSLMRAVLALVLLSVCRVRACTPSYSNNPGPTPDTPDPMAPDFFSVRMQLSVPNSEPIIINVTREWAPLGADRFYALVQDGHYNCAGTTSPYL